VQVSYNRASGRHVIVDHGGGWQSLYLHLHDFAPGLSVGDKVAAGEILGSVGCSGYCTSPHLHFALKHNGQFKDPLKYTRSYSAPQAQLAKNHANMVSHRRLAAWRDSDMVTPAKDSGESF
jgi:murein DD-endopeptidase MepM/ murein hydrolase activator NlpD